MKENRPILTKLKDVAVLATMTALTFGLYLWLRNQAGRPKAERIGERHSADRHDYDAGPSVKV